MPLLQSTKAPTGPLPLNEHLLGTSYVPGIVLGLGMWPGRGQTRATLKEVLAAGTGVKII